MCFLYFFGQAPSNGAFTRSQFCVPMDFTIRNHFISVCMHAMKCSKCTLCYTWVQIPWNFSLMVWFAWFLALAKCKKFGILGRFIFHIRIKTNFRSFCREILKS